MKTMLALTAVSLLSSAALADQEKVASLIPQCAPATIPPRVARPARRVTATVTPTPVTALPVAAHQNRCYLSSAPAAQSCMAPKPLCDQDLAIGKIAWKYFQNNYQPATGLVNAVDKYESTTMWDTASVLAGTVAAHALGIIDAKTFDDRITALLSTLIQLKLFRGEVPNKAYNTRTGEMTDYGNKVLKDGIGFSALDLARLASWLDLLGCMYPKHAVAAQRALQRWSYCHVVGDGQLYGAYLDPASHNAMPAQEGRLGYEQYAGKTFQMLGFDQHLSATYRNPNAQVIRIYDLPIAYDVRDPRKLGAYNYVVTESYALDAMEFGLDDENAALVRNIYEVQKRRWKDTGIVTAVSEDNLDRQPYFVYNTIFAAGSPWNAITDQGVDQSAFRTVSTKAAFSLATLFPDDPYSAVLIDKIMSAYDPERGWYSGIYESGIGYNKAITANTNGIILEALLFKARGALHPACSHCGHEARLRLGDDTTVARNHCLPGAGCNSSCGATASAIH